MHKIGRIIIWSMAAITSGCVLLLSAAFLYLNPQIPDAATFKDVKIRAPMRIYSADRKLIQEFGERLTPIRYEEIPPLFVQALLDTEDKRFFEHSGIDLITVANATWLLIRNQGSIRSGASTITMQLVKNISGESQVRFIRKFKEMLLALKIERELSKKEILTLYLNIIPFGKHAFGIQAAANTYYGEDIGQLTLAQIAMLAGIPKAPEAGNPINGPERALARRNLVLQRMLDQNSISRAQFEESSQAPLTARVHQRTIELPALYIAEMVRKRLLTEYGRGAYNRGLIVHTTIDSDMQLAAEKAVLNKLNQYDRRHGYRGPEYRRIHGSDEYVAAPEYGYPANWIASLEKAQVLGNQYPAIVIAIRDQEIDVLNQDLETITIAWEGMSWARTYLTVNSRGRKPRGAAEISNIGDFIRIEPSGGNWNLGQVPDIQGALVALDPKMGAIKALVGGYDFKAKQFNHATQAKRQPGSNFKPFFYAGAIENGLTAATIFNDAPIVLPGGELEQTYRPRNSGGSFQGNMRLREALYRSVNLVSLRVILNYGPVNAINYVKRFGFDTSGFPKDVQLAFGGGTIALTPLDIVTGYATFANGGFKITPYLIEQIDSINEDVVFKATPAIACITDCEEIDKAPRVVEARVAYIMNSILSDAIRRGTGTKALRALQRSDLKGKTGTTNDADIWFSGYTHDLVATSWAGFSDNSPVGNREWGSTTPIETWIEFMEEALPAESSSTTLARPNGIVSVRIDPDTGFRAEPSDPDAIFEIFRKEFAPTANLAGKEEEADPYKQIF
ncbi:MAG: PBP1A family penicillin-binding protein [Gammaproteobacteria bacterium]|nr:PBP1A family penicillin-binding protein [Gammaproteobacteria bacterium]